MRTIALLALTLTAFAGDKPEVRWRSPAEGFDEARRTRKTILLWVFAEG